MAEDPIQSDKEFEPAAEPKSSKVWLNLIKDAKKAFADYHRKADDIDRLYADLSRLTNTAGDRQFQLFWANVQVLAPSIYARPPVPVVVPKFRDRRPLFRVSSELLERSCITAFDMADINSVMVLLRDDLAVTGRGSAWVRYETSDKSDTPTERIVIEHVDRKDFLHDPARKWHDVGWVARRAYLTRHEMEDRFGRVWAKAAYEVQRKEREKGAANSQQKAAVWEIWCKSEDKVVWVTEGVDELLDEGKPHLKLEGFFPCPQPAYATVQRGSLVPVPDMLFYKDQLEELNQLTGRIHALSDALQVRGFYPAGAGEIGDAIETALKTNDNRQVMIPVSNWAAFGTGGAKDTIVWLPIDVIAATVQGLVELRRQIIDDVYQIMGLSDIMRGSTEKDETATAQQIKAQFGSVRIRDKQAELVRIARDVVRIGAEIGDADPDVCMMTVEGRISGVRVNGFYLDAANKAGRCWRDASSVSGAFFDIVAQRFTTLGIELDAQVDAPNSSWFSRANIYTGMHALNGAVGAKAWKISGRDNGAGINNGIHMNVYIGLQGSASRSLDPAHEPCALHLGYTDSSNFIECDFSLTSVTEDLIVDDRAALKALNGTGRDDGEKIKLRYWGNGISVSPPPNIRLEILYQFVAGSDETADDDNYIEPADGVGRFVKMQGAAVMLDATVRNGFPQNIFLNGCSLMRDPSMLDVTKNSNTPGRPDLGVPAVVLLNHPQADAEDTPHIPGVVGRTDGGVNFGSFPEVLLGDARKLIFEQANRQRKFEVYLNALSSTGAESSGHLGTVLRHMERSTDYNEWVETGRVTLTRGGHLMPNTGLSQGLGSSTAPWVQAYLRDLILSQSTAAGTPQVGQIKLADSVVWDPLETKLGVSSPYLVQYLGGAWKPLAPGRYQYEQAIADDAVVTIVPPKPSGFLKVWTNGTTSRWGRGYCVTTSAPDVFDQAAGTNFAWLTGALTGTTGDDGKLSVSATENAIQIENRSGATTTVHLLLECAP